MSYFGVDHDDEMEDEFEYRRGAGLSVASVRVGSDPPVPEDRAHLASRLLLVHSVVQETLRRVKGALLCAAGQGPDPRTTYLEGVGDALEAVDSALAGSEGELRALCRVPSDGRER